MTQVRKARIVTAIILGCLAGLIVVRKFGLRPVMAEFSAQANPTPQDVIYGMLDAGRTGDVARYIASCSGELERSLRRAMADSTDFSKYLRDSNAAIKGVAVMEAEPQTDREVRARVEYVYADRNEAQFFYLEKTATGWKIDRIDPAERVKTLTPYGTPVQ